MEKKKIKLPKKFDPRIVSLKEFLEEIEERQRKRTREDYKIYSRRKEDEPEEKNPFIIRNFRIPEINKFSKNKIYNENRIINSYISDLSETLKKEYISEKYSLLKIEKNLEKIILKNYNIGNINKTSFGKKGLGLGLYLNTPYLIGEPTVSITAENIGEYVLPIVQYIAEQKPDYVIASDRGARLIGLAVKMLYKRLYGRLPTVDGTLRFRRFSTSNGQEKTEQYLRPLVSEMLAHKRKPKVLLLDDWICSGSTQTLAENTFSNLSRGKVNLKFGVLLGRGADISGQGGYTSNFGGTVDWHDNTDLIGVNYSGTRAKPVRSYQAIEYRQRMQTGIDKLARKILSGERKREQKPRAELVT